MGAAAAPIAIGMTVLGAAVTAIGQIQASNAAQSQARYEAAIARNNEIRARQLAEDARLRGEAEAADRKRYYSQLEGRQRAALASNNVVVDEGSALDIVADTAAAATLDDLTIRSNAEREALGFEQQGANFRAEAEMADLRRKASRASLPFEVAGTILSSGTAVAGKWYEFDRTGAFG